MHRPGRYDGHRQDSHNLLFPRSRASVWAIFPPAWKLPQLVALAFCNITRAQMAEALDSKVGAASGLHLLGPSQHTAFAASLRAPRGLYGICVEPG